MIIRWVHGCDARIDHESRVTKRAIKIRNRSVLKRHMGRLRVWAGEGGAGYLCQKAGRWSFENPPKWRPGGAVEAAARSASALADLDQVAVGVAQVAANLGAAVDGLGEESRPPFADQSA